MSNINRNKIYLVVYITFCLLVLSFRLFIFPVLENKVIIEEQKFQSSEIRNNFIAYRSYLSHTLNKLGYAVGYAKYTDEMITIEKKVIYLDKMISIKNIDENSIENKRLNMEYLHLKNSELIKVKN